MRFLAVLSSLTVGTILTLPAETAADSCRVVRQRVVVNHAHAAAVVVEKAVVATFAAVPVAVPHYSVGFDPAGAELQALRRELAELRGALLKGAAAPAGAAGAPSPPAGADVQARAVNILAARCSKCHTGDTAKGGLKIFDAPGQVSGTLNALDVAAMMSAVKDGVMPPAPAQPLSDEEYLAVDVWGKPLVKAARKAAAKK